jgi:hypothetical protein
MAAILELITSALRAVQAAGGLQSFLAGRANQLPSHYKDKAGDHQTSEKQNDSKWPRHIQNAKERECDAAEQGSHEEGDADPLAAPVSFGVGLENKQKLATLLRPEPLRKP